MRRLMLAITAVALAACEDATPPLANDNYVEVSLVNGVPGSGIGGIALLIDGEAVTTADFGDTASVTIAPGQHTVEVRRVVNGGPGSAPTVAFVAGRKWVIVAVQPALGGPEPLLYGDTNAVVPPNATKLRVIHGAAMAPAITVRRTQPDFDSLITVMFPFNYNSASSYLQSTPGSWSVVVSHENQSDTLAMTGAIAVAAGQSRTVVILDDGAGGVRLAVVNP